MRFCAMALASVSVTCSWPTTSAKRCGRYLRAMTWYDIYDLRFTIYEPAAIAEAIVNPKSQIVNAECQGDHGRCRANYRCCLPALAGFVSQQSMGPGEPDCAAARVRLQVKLNQMPRLPLGRRIEGAHGRGRGVGQEL